MKYIIFFLSLIFLNCSSVKKNSCKSYFDGFTSKCVFLFVEKMPSYSNRENGFIKFFVQHFHYPENVTELITRIDVQFVIDENGKLMGERIMNKKMKDINLVEQEVLRVVRLTNGGWTPGKINGEEVAVLLTFPFQLEPNR